MPKEIMETKNTEPSVLINEAISKGADLEELEKLLTLQERWEANEAKKAFHIAMSKFKENPPKINKDQKVNYSTSRGNVGYSHASLANIIEKITAELSKNGLSVSWRTNQTAGISVTCRITHIRGHYEETSLIAEADQSGSKNSIQAIGSTITYLQRYTLMALVGLATYDQDDDGLASECISNDQLHELRDLLISVGEEKNESKLLKFLGVDSLEKLPVTKFDKAIKALNEKKKKNENN